MDAMEREIEILEQQLENGEISTKEYNQYVRELEADARACAEEEAQRAYDDVMYSRGYYR